MKKKEGESIRGVNGLCICLEGKLFLMEKNMIHPEIIGLKDNYFFTTTNQS